MANEVVVSGTFSGTTSSSALQFRGNFNLSLSTMTGSTVVLERSHDDGSTYFTVETFVDPVERYVVSPQSLTKWRLRCTVNASTVVYRLSCEA